jgi:hypothetical protein
MDNRTDYIILDNAIYPYTQRVPVGLGPSMYPGSDVFLI